MNSLSSVLMIINHAIINLTGERNILVRWKNNLWSFYVLLRALENNNTPQQKHTNNWKAPSVINLMGFAYFASLTRSRQKKSHGIRRKRPLQNTNWRQGFTWRQTCFSGTHLWLKSWRLSKQKLLKRTVLCQDDSKSKFISRVISHKVCFELSELCFVCFPL